MRIRRISRLQRECTKNALDAFQARMELIQSCFAHSQQQGHIASMLAHTITRHMPPTTTNVSDDMPPPPLSPHQHSHTWGVAHKRVTQPLQPTHATTPELPQRRVATPKVEEDTEGTPGRITSRPQGVMTRIFLRHTADVRSDSGCPTPCDRCDTLHYRTPRTQLGQVSRCFPFLLQLKYFSDILRMSSRTPDVRLCAMAIAFLHYQTTCAQLGRVVQ